MLKGNTRVFGGDKLLRLQDQTLLNPTIQITEHCLVAFCIRTVRDTYCPSSPTSKAGSTVSERGDFKIKMKGFILLHTSFWSLCGISQFSLSISRASGLKVWSPQIPLTCLACLSPYVFYAVQCQGAGQPGHLYICLHPARRGIGRT